MNFVMNDPDFRQVVNREQFCTAMMNNLLFNTSNSEETEDFTSKNMEILLN